MLIIDLLSSDGEPSHRVWLHADGSSLEGGANVHPEHRQADQEDGLQCAAHPEVYIEVQMLRWCIWVSFLVRMSVPSTLVLH